MLPLAISLNRRALLRRRVEQQMKLSWPAEVEFWCKMLASTCTALQGLRASAVVKTQDGGPRPPERLKQSRSGISMRRGFDLDRPQLVVNTSIDVATTDPPTEGSAR